MPNIAIFNERKQKGFQNEELLSVSITRGVVRQSDMGKKDISSPDKSNYKLVMPGDLAYGMEFRKGAIGYSVYRGIVSPVYTILKPKIEINPRFFHYQYRLDFYTNYVWRYVYGIGEHFLPLRSKDFKRMYSIVPPLDAQNAIVAYLDRKAERANDFIAKQTRLIEVLNEQKQAMINKAVTRGINPDAPMKESGIEWLGDIPAHWEVMKLKYILTIQNGVGIMSTDVDSKGSYPVFGGNGIMGYTEKFNSDTLDIIIGRVGAKCGNIHLADGCKWISDNALVAKTNQNYKFTSLLLKVLDLNKLSKQNAQPLITGTLIKNQKIAVPALDEQKKIAMFIESEIAKVNTATVKAEKQIALANDYLHSLIFHTVTGQRAVPF